jgi:hypothetical protein
VGNKSLKNQREKSKEVYLRTEDTMAKIKGTNNATRNTIQKNTD